MSSELCALSELARSACGWICLLRELELDTPGPVTLFTDSTSALLNANHYLTHSKSRAVRLRSWHVREAVDAGMIRVLWRSGKELHVDGLTKAAQPVDYQRQQNEAMCVIA